MRRLFVKFLLAAVLSVLACMLFRPTVGFRCTPETTGVVAFQSTAGRVAAPVDGGTVSFRVPVLGRDWAFAFSAGRYEISGLTVCGFPTVAPGMLAGLVHDGPPQSSDGAHLVLDVAADSPPLCHPRLYRYIAVTLDIARALLLAVVWLAVFWKGVLRLAATVACRLKVLDGTVGFAAVLALVTLFVLVPPPVSALEFNSVDPAAFWVLNRFACSSLWGDGLVFTYGPLGFLIYPLTLPTALGTLAFNAFAILLFVFLLVSLHGQGGRGARAMAWLLLLLAFVPVRNMEWRWVGMAVALLLACALPELAAWRRRCFAAGAGVLFSVLVFMKFSAFLSLGATHFVVLAFLAARRRWPCVGAYLLAVVLPTLLLAVLVFPSVSSVLAWMRGSFEVAQGYNHQMHAPRSAPELLFMWSSLAAPVLAVLLARGRFRMKMLSLLILSPLLFSLYKYNAIRQGPIPLQMGGCLLLALAAGFLPEGRRTLSAAYAALLLFSVGCSVVYDPTFPAPVCHPRALADTLRLPSVVRRNAAQAASTAESFRLPVSWRERIGTNRVGFVTYLYDAAMHPGEAFRLVPFAAVQPYSAYTPHLDRFCAERLAGPAAPEFLVAQLDPHGIDGRNLVLDCPRVWTAVRSGYELVATNACHAFLERRKGGPVACAEPGASLDFRLGPLGQLLSFLYCPTRVFLKTVYATGAERVYTVSAPNLSAPFLHRSVPDSPEEMVDFLRNGLDKDVRALSLSFSRPSYVARGEVRVLRPADR